jgi:hypothetical protein
MKSLLTLSALLIAAVAGAQPANDKAAATKNLIESQNYVFRASTVLPMHGRVRQLTDIWDLTITKSAIDSYLPYFGRAYAAMDPTQNPMQFTAKDFEYTLKPHKKNGWDVLIKPKGLKTDVQQLSLSISSDGYANLQVIFNTRDAISYTGSILSPPKH